MRALKALPIAAALVLATLTAQAADRPQIPDKFTAPAPSKKEHRANTVMEPITSEARTRFVQSLMAGNPLSVRDMVNLMTYKVEANAGLSYDDVVSSMKQRANKLNFKFVGSNAIYKDVTATTGQPSPKVEIFNFCDAAVARELLDYSLEFAVFLPCRIAAVEDADKRIWLMMLDWDVAWLDTSPNPDRIPDSLRKNAARLRQGLIDIIRAGSSGDL
ncbi:MAG: DUF302 domain-containing protein [Rhodospirillaceae bacterium]|nr:DUF302 domain-containing protein [Rhodospirillales bacterium]